MPDSACLSANAICSTESASLPSENPTLSGDAKVKNLTFRMDQETGRWSSARRVPTCAHVFWKSMCAALTAVAVEPPPRRHHLHARIVPDEPSEFDWGILVSGPDSGEVIERRLWADTRARRRTGRRVRSRGRIGRQPSAVWPTRAARRWRTRIQQPRNRGAAPPMETLGSRPIACDGSGGESILARCFPGSACRRRRGLAGRPVRADVRAGARPHAAGRRRCSSSSRDWRAR